MASIRLSEVKGFTEEEFATMISFLKEMNIVYNIELERPFPIQSSDDED